MDTHPQGAQDDGAEFIPQAREVTFAGERIVIEEFDVLQTIKLIQQLKAVMASVRSGALPVDRIKALFDKVADGDEGDEAFDLDANDLDLAVSLLAEFGEPLTQAVAIAIRKPVSFVQSAKDFVGLVRLVITVAKVNASFFAQQASALLADLDAVVAPVGRGQTLSTPSSAPATRRPAC